MILSYYDFLLNETEIDEINQTIYNGNIDLEYAPKKPSPQNAAFDEFFSGIVVFLDSNEVQAFLAAVDIFLIFLNIVKRVKEYAANKKAYKVTSSTIEPLLNNVIIQVDNKKILEPQRLDNEREKLINTFKKYKYTSVIDKYTWLINSFNKTIKRIKKILDIFMVDYYESDIDRILDLRIDIDEIMNEEKTGE